MKQPMNYSSLEVMQGSHSGKDGRGMWLSNEFRMSNDLAMLGTGPGSILPGVQAFRCVAHS